MLLVYKCDFTYIIQSNLLNYARFFNILIYIHFNLYKKYFRNYVKHDKQVWFDRLKNLCI